VNKTTTNITENLGQSVGPESVLSDIEDLYVYSHEQLFRKQQFPELNLVVRVSSNEQAQRVLELSKKYNFTVIRRSAVQPEVFKSTHSPTVMIDDAIPPNLEILNEADEKERMAENAKEISRAGHGTFRNFALALKTLFMKMPASRCLECTPCSGYCTVTPSFNGVETWSSKGRALLIRGFSSGELQPSKKLIDVVYTCSLCGLCFAECFEDTHVKKAIMEARRHLSRKGLTPDLFTTTAKNILETGDVGGAPAAAKRRDWMTDLSAKPLDKADVLYWVGCVVASRTPNTAKAVVNVLSKADVSFSMLGEKEGCCGYVLLASGLWKEAKDVALRVVRRVRETRASVLVTSCAGCYYTFSKLYPEVLDVDLPVDIMHASQFARNLIKGGQLGLERLNLELTYHDPCSLGRHSEVFDEPRDVLKAVPNLRLVEMPLSKKRARCCGAGGGLWSFNYQASGDAAYTRLADDVLPMEVDTLATACPTCHVNLRHASIKKSLGIRIYDIMEILERALVTS